jgi:predicted alpha/beta-hydrolase family hydrolase
MREVELEIPLAADASLVADLNLPDDARGVVVFAHGSGSSRRSPRNRWVAAALSERGFATLLLDLRSPRAAPRRMLDRHTPLISLRDGRRGACSIPR